VGSFGDDGPAGGQTSTCDVTNPNDDMDKDGWTPNQGDCNDCDPNVNPGAIDVWHEPAEGGPGYWGNEDCSGNPGDNAKPCDTGLALDDVTAGDGAKAIELCATTTTSDRTYCVLSASYVRADGTAVSAPGAQVGIQTGWGTNVKVQGGASMLVLSSGYNDQLVALVDPPPMGAYVPTGSSFGNISFDSNNNPVSVNLGYFDVCDSTTPNRFASSCKSSGGTCPPLPSPYCPLGVGDLAGTGFDVWSTDGPAGATRWLKTQAPVTPGSTITIRFAMWDAGNALYDSTVLVDNFQWIATGGEVGVGTSPVQ
jgi:hypothetical protein